MTRVVAVAVAACIAMSCERPTEISVGAGRGMSSLTENGLNLPIGTSVETQDVEPIVLGLDPERFTDDRDLVALREAVQRSAGRVFISLKTPSQGRTRQTGVIPGMRKAEMAAARKAIESQGATIVRTFRRSSEVVAIVTPEIAIDLLDNPHVNHIVAARSGSIPMEPMNRESKVSLVVSSQDTTWGLKRIGAHLVWGSHTQGQSTNITLLDNGIDPTHALNEALDGPASLGNCLYVAPTLTSCFNEVNGHGTAVAAIMSGRNNSLGYLGVAPQPLQFNAIATCLPDGSDCPDEWVLEGLDWAIAQGYQRHVLVIEQQSCWANSLMEAKLIQAANAGILVVVPAGNLSYRCRSGPGSTGVTYPARYGSVLAVSGVTQFDQLASPENSSPCTSGSRYGVEIDLAAPFWSYAADTAGTWRRFCGTSFAGPMVAATAALVWSANPGMTANDVKARLQYKAIDLGPCGPDPQYGKGLVSAVHAVRNTNPGGGCGGGGGISVTIAGTASIASGQGCEWYAIPNGGVAPYSFAWTVDGQAVGSDSDILYYVNNGVAFTLAVVATDQNGAELPGQLQVSITPGAGCL